MKIGLLTCQRLPDLLPTDQLLIPELAKYNHQATAVIWDDASINWDEFDYLIFRNTWDYYEKEAAFTTWLDYVQKRGIKTLNAIEIIQKNKHKFYLRELEKKGISILPTMFINKTPALNLAKIIPLDWKKAVIKPAFSAGSYLTEVFDVTDIEKINARYQAIAVTKDLLLQEFMPQIEQLGETSFIFFNKKFSHAVNKKPAYGDFRVQIQFGGQYKLIQPDEKLIQKAQKVVDTFSEKLLYARVDGIVLGAELHLMEIECIEPDLYFQLSEGALERFVKSVIELIN